ncbi:M23 family metallopeptidase [Paraburkholderia caledonica]
MVLLIASAPKRTFHYPNSPVDGEALVSTQPLNTPPAPATAMPPPAAASAQPELVVKTATVTRTFSEAAQSLGITAQMTKTLADAFASKIDFQRDIEPGDKISFVFKDTGANAQSGSDNRRPVAAKISLGAVSHEIFLYKALGGKAFYYSKDGTPAKPSFSRYPVAFSRISSRFSSHRLDPVTHQWQSHEGVDLAAPIGTPVHATANGIVKFAGTQTGYGRIIIVSNQPPYSTRFAHLSRFAKGIHAGSKVRRNQVIGYVGKTGWATGPHLHYEVRVDHVATNPLTVALPQHHRLRGADREHFAEQAEERMALL